MVQIVILEQDLNYFKDFFCGLVNVKGLFLRGNTLLLVYSCWLNCFKVVSFFNWINFVNNLKPF